MEDKEREISRLKRRVVGLEKTLQIVTRHSGRIEKNLKQLFGSVSDTMPVPLLIASKTGDILYWNQNALDTFGHADEVFRNLNAVDLYENPEARSSLLKKLDELEEVRGFTVPLKKASGASFPASLFSRRIVFEGRDCLLTVFYDLSELKKEEEKRLSLEKQLRQTQKMEAIGTLASGIAHDFSNILTIIFGRLQLAEMVLPKDAKSRAHIQQALSAADRAKAMIMQILTFCRQNEEERRPFQVSPVVSEAAKMIRSFVPPNLDVRLRIGSKSSMILGDPTQIYQVVMNLGTNAVYALEDRNGAIEVATEEMVLGHGDPILIPPLVPGRYVRLSITDNGPGIAEGIIERVFDPFFTTKPVGEGTGMGLAVVHGIVQGHNGAVSVESEPGKGTAFHCYFPIVARAESETASTATDDDAVRGGDEHILVVDDEEPITEICAGMLESLGYRVTVRNRSRDALELFLENPDRFDAVITDEVMPGMSGSALASEVSRVRPDLPVVVITGMQVDDRRILAAGAAAVVRKPFKQKGIGAILRGCLDRGPGKGASPGGEAAPAGAAIDPDPRGR